MTATATATATSTSNTVNTSASQIVATPSSPDRLGRTMSIVRPIATLIMASGFGFFGVAKIVTADVVSSGAAWSRLSETQWAAIGVLEVVAVISLLLALSPRFRALGVAGATGLAVLTGCAVVFHIVNGDPASDIAPAVIQGLVATIYASLGARSLRR